MREYGRVAPTFWTRGSGKKLRGKPLAQVVALYLFTCPSSTMIGIYHLAIPTMAHEIGITLEDAERALAEVCDVGIAQYDHEEELLYLPEGARYQIGESLKPGDKRVAGIRAALAQFNRHPFATDFASRYAVDFCISPSGEEAPQKPLPRGILETEKPLGSQARQGKDQAITERRTRGGFEAAPPSGSGPSSVRALERTPLAPDEAPAPPTGNLAGSEVDEEAPVLGTTLVSEPPHAPQDHPTTSDAPAGQPEPQTAPRPDEPATPPETAPAMPGPVDEPVAPSDPGQATLPLALVPLATLKKKSDPVEDIFAEYVTAWKKSTRGRRPPKLDDKRRRLTLARLRDFAEDDLKAAARGVFASEWHVENHQTSYELVMRDAAHVERFRAADDASRPAERPWTPDPGRPSARVMEALRRQRDSPPAENTDLNAMIDDIGRMRMP